MSKQYDSQEITIASSGTGLLSALGKPQIDSPKFKLNTTYFIQSLGSGTLSIKPIVNGDTTHTAYTITNDSIWLDLTNVEDFDLTETSTTNAVNVTVVAFRGTDD